MKRPLLVVACAAALGSAALAAAKPAPPTGAVSVTLPGDAGMQFKAGTGVVAAQTYCLTCHSSAYVSTQPALTRAQWIAEVTKMRSVFGATIPDDQTGILVDYLTTQYGKP